MKLKYNCDNEYLIESKSLKLYLNSFNMSRFGETIEECLQICKDIITIDLSDKLETKVEIEFLSNNAERVEIYNQFENIIKYVDEEDLEIAEFKEAPEVLEIEEKSEVKEYYLTFDSLRSNCRVTHQPDFGDAFMYYKSSKHITESSLVKYLSSFRSEYHFHEECCEMIFKRLKDLLNDEDELFISALYTRRGGIDICPSRWTTNCSFKEVEKLLDTSCFARSGNKQ
jgi:7-cyano-7-deazaguanine reductase